MQSGNSLGFDAHHLRPALCGRRNAAHQPAAAYSNKDGVDVGQFIQQLKAHATGAGHDLGLVVSVAVDRAFFLGETDRSGIGFGVLGAALDHGGTNGIELMDLVCRGRLRDEHGCRDSKLGCGIGIGQAGIATGSHHDAHLRVQLAVLLRREQPVEGAACLEGAGVLHVLAFEPQVVRPPGRRSRPAGVCRTQPAVREYAASTSSRVTIVDAPFVHFILWFRWACDVLPA